MANYVSKHTGAQIDAAVENVGVLEGKVTTLSEEIVDLGKTIKEGLTGEFDISEYAGFVSCAGTWMGKPTGTDSGGKRVVSNNIMMFEYDIIIKIAAGFEYGVMNFTSNGTYDSSGDRPAVSVPSTIPAGMYFRLQLKRTVENDSEIADAEYFASQLTVTKANDEEQSAVKQMSNRAASNFNIFNPPLYHHMNQEESRYCNIPAESLADIHYAKALGFNNIEVNPQLCADGVYVCKHGTSGCLGYGLSVADGKDPLTTKFTDVTSTWIRENVRYTSSLDKYKGVIPTLDEFCAECRKLNMIVKLYGLEPLAVARKYLPDDMIWTTASERGDFRGTIEYIWTSAKSVDFVISECKEIGPPLNIVIEAGTFDDKSDDLIIEMCTKAHENGFTVGMVYPTSESLLRAWRLGVDTAGATSTNVNYLPYGNEKNIVSLDDTDLTLTNATYNSSADTLTITNGGSVTVDGEAFKAGIASLRIRYSGTLTIYNNEKRNHLDAYVSDGSGVVELSTVIQQLGVTKYTRWLTIEANADTTIYDFELHCSRI